MQATTNLGLLKGIYQDVRWDQSYDELFNGLDEALGGWVRYGWINRPATAAATDKFEIPGDVTNLFPATRKVRCVLSGSQPVVTVSVASYAGNVTTVTVVETTIDGTLTSIWVNAFDCLYASAATFTVAGDKTGVFTAGLAIKVQLAGGTVYGRVVSSSYSVPDTTVIIAGCSLTDPMYCLWVSPVRPRLAADSNMPADVSPGAMGALPGQIYGIKLSNNGGDAVNDVDASAGFAFSDDAALADVACMTLGSALTKRLDATWAVGSGNGGLDTGSVGNGTYFDWLIMRPDTGVVDRLFSLSASSPTMPANYTKKALLGMLIRAGGTILAFTQSGDDFSLTTPTLDLNVGDPGTSAASAALKVPVGIKVKAKFNWEIICDGTNQHRLYASDLAVADQAPVSGAVPLFSGRTTTAANLGGLLEVLTNTAAQIRYRLDSSGVTTFVRFSTLSWNDRFGRRGCI